MRLVTWVAVVSMVGVLSLAGGCGSSHSRLMEAAGGDGGGGLESVGEDECRRTSDCDDQVCSPDGRCIDCYHDDDCRAGQHCDDERCVSDDTGEGGSSSGASGGSGGNAGSGNPGGSSGSGGRGGSGRIGSCDTAQVLFVIQRSGAMFELPALEANYWSMVKDAIVGPQGAAATYEARLDLGALFLVRLSTSLSCPTLSVMEPTSPSIASLAALFDQNLEAYTAQSQTDKMDAPVAEAVAAAAGILSGTPGHIVLITTAVPDTCTVADSHCTVDPTIKAVQDARAQGVRTHVIGLGDTPNLDYLTTDGYEGYLAQLANAGAGEPVKLAEGYQYICPTTVNEASYSATSGIAQAHQAFTSVDVKAAVTQILSGICP